MTSSRVRRDGAARFKEPVERELGQGAGERCGTAAPREGEGKKKIGAEARLAEFDRAGAREDAGKSRI